MIGGEYEAERVRPWDSVGSYDPDTGRVAWNDPHDNLPGLAGTLQFEDDGDSDDPQSPYTDDVSPEERATIGAEPTEEIQIPMKMWGDLVRELNGLTSGQLAVGVREFIDHSVNRVLTVGREQYDEGTQQKFERMPLPKLCDWALEELQDVAVYSAMLAVRIQRIRDQFNG